MDSKDMLYEQLGHFEGFRELGKRDEVGSLRESVNNSEDSGVTL